MRGYQRRGKSVIDFGSAARIVAGIQRSRHGNAAGNERRGVKWRDLYRCSTWPEPRRGQLRCPAGMEAPSKVRIDAKTFQEPIWRLTETMAQKVKREGPARDGWP